VILGQAIGGGADRGSRHAPLPETTADEAAGQLLIHPHHPDRLRLPACRPDRVIADRTANALTWNVFRALELLPPAFWLRRLNARLQNADIGGPAPLTVKVSLWRSLEPSPGQAIAGDTAPVRADVVIETEHLVWLLLTTCGTEILWPDADAAVLDPVGRLADAGSWLAGRRDLCCGLIVSRPEDAPVGSSLIRKYAGQNSVLRFPSSRSAPALRGAGLATWRDLAAILEDCEASPILGDLDRLVARTTLAWIARSSHLAPDLKVGPTD
jgi:hypothetical protein